MAESMSLSNSDIDDNNVDDKNTDCTTSIMHDVPEYQLFVFYTWAYEKMKVLFVDNVITRNLFCQRFD